jgi:hypothetical protein
MVHNVAAVTDRGQLPAHVASLLIDCRQQALQQRQMAYRRWCGHTRERAAGLEQELDQHLSQRHHGRSDYGFEL